MTSEKILKFRGTPARMEAIVPFSGELSATPVTLDLGADALGETRFSAVRVGNGFVRLSLRVPRSAPPGSYGGTVHLGTQDLPFVAEVEPVVHLTVSPRHLKLEAPALSMVEASLTLANTGNAVGTIRTAYGLGLFRVGGVEDALSAAYRAPKVGDCSWINRVGEELSEAHSGLIRVKVTEGAGDLLPGEMKTLGLAFRLTEKMDVGRTYTGTLPIHNLAYYIEVCVTRPPVAGEGEQSGSPVIS